MVNAVDHTTSAVPAGAETRRPLPRDRRRGALTRPARQSSLREHNLSLALRYIVDSPVPTTRARVADGTGLTKATVYGDLRLAEVEFGSIGTNDLAQYTMAADRMQGELSDLLDPWHDDV